MLKHHIVISAYLYDLLKVMVVHICDRVLWSFSDGPSLKEAPLYASNHFFSKRRKVQI